MRKKYEFTGDEKVVGGVTLKRIRAIRDFGDVKKGDIGGWIEGESNLSHEENSWVYDEAKVYNGARVFGKAHVYGEVRVYDEAKVYGEAQVYGEARVYDEAQVYDEARIYDEAKVYDEAQVYGEAKVYGKARVYDEAQVYGEARIYAKRDILTFKCVGSRGDTLTAFRAKKGYLINVGCFLGSLEEFLKKVEITHGNRKFAKEYQLIAEVIKQRFEGEEK